jgi:hypothetical protein
MPIVKCNIIRINTCRRVARRLYTVINLSSLSLAPSVLCWWFVNMIVILHVTLAESAMHTTSRWLSLMEHVPPGGMSHTLHAWHAGCLLAHSLWEKTIANEKPRDILIMLKGGRKRNCALRVSLSCKPTQARYIAINIHTYAASHISQHPMDGWMATCAARCRWMDRISNMYMRRLV